MLVFILKTRYWQELLSAIVKKRIIMKIITTAVFTLSFADEIQNTKFCRPFIVNSSSRNFYITNYPKFALVYPVIALHILSCIASHIVHHFSTNCSVLSLLLNHKYNSHKLHFSSVSPLLIPAYHSNRLLVFAYFL